MSKRLYNNKADCCGCSSCSQICPPKCISMVADPKEGFFYPEVNSELCIHCGACERVCPFKNKNEYPENKGAYALVHKDEEYRYEFTSSGAFEILCRNFCGIDSCDIYGVAIDEQLRVKHICISNVEELQPFRKSKYVQSNLGDTFRSVKKSLAEGKKVVFSGSPCQVAGLQRFLGKTWANLLTVDFVCHGVPSQYVFDGYVDDLSVKYGSKVKEVIFRNKVLQKDRWDCLGMKYIFEDGREIDDLYPPCQYMEGFLTDLYVRQSCHHCPFANMKRVSDITLGDSWGMDGYEKKLSMTYTNGTSLVMMNTDKGKELLKFNNAAYDLIPVPVDILPEAQRQLREPSTPHRCRNRFFNLFQYLSFSEAKDIATKRTRLFYYREMLKLSFRGKKK